MRVELHPSATRDLEEAAGFYASEGSPALAARFVADFERVVRLLAINPDLGAPGASGRRRFAMGNFPYSVIYRTYSTGIRVLVVRHDRRRPDFGNARR
jgi:plasmid stabilization system protein ParE